MLSVKVDDVRIAEKPCQECPTKDAIGYLTTKAIEACSDPYAPIVPCDYHGLVQASHIAFAEHRPLVLSPDMIWLTIAQGVANHVNANAEQLRKQFVKHEGKQLIRVQRDDFFKGSMDNNWPGVFSEFSTRIQEYLQSGAYDRVTASFTTTGLVEKTANEIVLMDTVKSYFDYRVRTLCGIPEVTLEGEPKDWEQIATKVGELQNCYGLDWWLSALLPVVTQMYYVSCGKGDGKLFKDWYKLSGGSGGPYVSGNILKFFPYLKDYETGEATEKVKSFDFRTTSDCLPSGLSSVPFIWEYLLREIPMKFLAGFIGYTQNSETMAVRPKIGWAVMDQAAGFATGMSQTCTECGVEKLKTEFRDWGDNKGLCNDCLRKSWEK